MTILKTLANTRVDRHTFWIIFAVVVLASFVVKVVADGGGISSARGAVSVALIWGIFSLVAAGRARDMGRSGWLALLTLIPVANLAVVLWLGCSRSAEGFLASEVAANAAVLATFERGPQWMSLIEISNALGDDASLVLPREKTAARVRALDAQGTLTNNGQDGRERRYRIA